MHAHTLYTVVHTHRAYTLAFKKNQENQAQEREVECLIYAKS